MADLKFEKTEGLTGIEYRAHGERVNYRVRRCEYPECAWVMEAYEAVMVGTLDPVRVSGDMLTSVTDETRRDSYEAANLYEISRNR